MPDHCVATRSRIRPDNVLPSHLDLYYGGAMARAARAASTSQRSIPPTGR